MLSKEALELSILFFLIPNITYIVLLVYQFLQQEPTTVRLQILSTRCALFLPFYSFLIFISLLSGELVYIIFQIPLTIFEGYSFYCFFVLLVTNLGGPTELISYLQKGRLACCNSFCTSDSVVFYKKACNAMKHFLITRSIISVLNVICLIVTYINGSKIANILGLVSSVLNVIILFYALLHLVLICKI
jgi:hypothetical protein